MPVDNSKIPASRGAESFPTIPTQSGFLPSGRFAPLWNPSDSFISMCFLFGYAVS